MPERNPKVTAKSDSLRARLAFFLPIPVLAAVLLFTCSTTQAVPPAELPLGEQTQSAQAAGSVSFMPDMTAYSVIDTIVVSIGGDMSELTAIDFIEGSVPEAEEGRFALAVDLSNIDTSTVGEYEIDVLLDGFAFPKKTILEVRDVIPPKGKPVTLERWSYEEFSAGDFVTDIEDQTEVTVSYIKEPDLTKEGRQSILIVLTDESGNTSEIASTLILSIDTEPPVIEGSFDKAAVIGDPILYREGITVTDNHDEDVALMVDSSAVIPTQEGNYPVIYSATDRSGNTTVVEGSLRVVNLTIDNIDNVLAAVLSEIFTDGMSKEEQAKAIHQYVKSHIQYGYGPEQESMQHTAYMALKSGIGDCYYYYALAEMLLTQAGIDNMPIERAPGIHGRHYWSLVNLGSGWHHFDTCPSKVSGYTNNGFMFTESQAEAATAAHPNSPDFYYVYDKSLYPEVVQ